MVETKDGWSKIKNGGWIKSEFLVAPEKLSSDIIIINIGNQKATYYKDGKKVSAIKRDKNNKKIASYTYNDDGTVKTKTYTKSGYVKTFAYKDGVKTSAKVVDKKGNLVKTIYYNSDGSVKSVSKAKTKAKAK